MKTTFLLLLLTCIVNLWAVEFTAGPTVTDQGDSVAITFSVDGYTDVTIAILDDDGKIIRHLAAGQLGANPPAPFTANSLSQTLGWDKRDDKGNVVTGSYDVKVGLTMVPKLDKWYTSDDHKYFSGYVQGVAVDTAGNVIVMDRGYRGDVFIRKYNRDGEYVSTLHPYPSYHAEEKLAGFGRIALKDGRKVPYVAQAHEGTLIPELHYVYRQTMAVSPQNWLVLTNTMGHSYWYGTHTKKVRLLIMGADGSCPRDSIFGPVIYGQQNNAMGHSALSPDGQTVYFAGLDGFYAAFKAPLNSTAQASVFAGSPTTAGTGDGQFGSLTGIATDSSGNVYVSDNANHRIAVFDSSGTFLGNIATSSPDMLRFDKKRNALYVLMVNPNLTYVQIRKFSAWPGGDSLACATIGWQSNISGCKNNPPVFAVDVNAPSPLLWIGATEYSNKYMACYVDNGTTIVSNGVRIGKQNYNRFWAGSTNGAPGYIAVDPNEEVLYAGCKNWTQVDVATGDLNSSSVKGQDIAFGPDRSFYTFGGTNGYWDSTIYRYDLEGNRINFPGGASSFQTPTTTFIGPNFGSRGMAVSPDNHLYFLNNSRGDHAHSANNTILRKFDSTGVLVSDSIMVATNAISGLRVDAQGNIYTSISSRPSGVTYPHWMADSPLLPNPFTDNLSQPYVAPYVYYNYYLMLFHSLMGDTHRIIPSLLIAVVNHSFGVVGAVHSSPNGGLSIGK
jgi:sugar lactone lactonase YvrE